MAQINQSNDYRVVDKYVLYIIILTGKDNTKLIDCYLMNYFQNDHQEILKLLI